MMFRTHASPRIAFEGSNVSGRSRCLTATMVLVLLASSTASAQVRWRAGKSEQSGKPRAASVGLLAERTAEPRHLVVQFERPLSAPERAELAAAGVTLTAYLGDHAYFAAVDARGADPDALAPVKPLTDVREILTVWKLHPLLASPTAPAWSTVAPPAGQVVRADEPWVPVYILFHADVTAQAVADVAKRHGLTIRTTLKYSNAQVVEMPFALLGALAAEDAVQYVEPALPALEAVNNGNIAASGVGVISAPPYGLDGGGVSVLVYDAGTARATHVDFEGRLTARDASGMIDHATHVSGTVGGAGLGNALYRGMAPGVTIESFGYEQVGGLAQGFLYTDPGDLEADYTAAVNILGADLANNSIGTNVASNGFPCEWEGDYGVTDTVIDAIVRGSLGTPFRVIWANGNERGNGRCGAAHRTTAPPACAKNHITVGAINSDDDAVTWFTSWGPTDDGRLKPEISAPGCELGGDGGVTSCDSASDTAYVTYRGTSMAAPTVTGLSALILQDYRAQFPSRPDPRNSTLKTILAHTAGDLATPGPDYQTGYGAVRAQQAVDFVRTGSFYEASLAQGDTDTALVLVHAGDPELKITLAWDDVPAAPNVIPSLVNDLDIRVFSPGGLRHYPWTLGGTAAPADPAVRTQADHVNNLEQVLVENPEPGVWTVEIHAFNIPQGPQPYSVAITPAYSPDCNANGVEDVQDVTAGTSADCNANSVPDECEPAADCNSNGTQDICDIAAALSFDINANLIPDECEPDCNGNDLPDDHDIATGTSPDCNANGVPDGCDIGSGASADCAADGVPDECEPDCNANGVGDICDATSGTSVDCDGNAVPDECQGDCNGNGIADACDIASGVSKDADANGYPDECSRLFVSATATGNRTGWSWHHAHTDFGLALAQAAENPAVTEIWVAAGRYTPAPPGGSRAATFTLPAGVRIFGGFRGTEATLGQRNWGAHETILSGDLAGNDHPGDWGGSSDNSQHVVTATDLDANSVLDGFTIRGGYAVWSGGTGLLLTNSSLRVENCRLSRNLINFSYGGAVSISDGHPVFINCTFDGNYAHLGKGGAVYLYGTAGATFDDCSFTGNTSVGSTNGSPEAAGAAIAHWGEGPLTITDSLFDYNVSRGFYAGGSNGAYAGAIDHFGPGSLTIDRCIFTDNQSNQGGAIWSWRNLTITNSVFARNRAPQFNSTFGWGGQGGAVGASSFVGTDVIVNNCVFYANSAEDAGGLGAYGAALLTVSNSIFWNNTDNRGNIGDSQVSGGDITHCCIMNMLLGAPGEDPPDPARFPGSTDLNPLFVAAAFDDFRLSEGSPCIDAGRNASVPTGIIRDLDGRYRFLDEPTVPDVGAGAAPVVDMGAYETGPAGGGDFDANGRVELFDYFMLADCLAGPDAGPVSMGCVVFDFDADTDVDLRDVAAFQAVFDAPEPPLDPPALIQGLVTYSGADTGQIHIVATGLAVTTATFEALLASPGAYQLPIDRTGSYRISAFLDIDGDGAADAAEPAAEFAGNPVVIAAAGEVHTGIDIPLGGVHAITGRLTWWDWEGGAWNIPVELSGAATATTTTDNEGYYSFADLADGTYTVTPTSTTRYCYPYFRQVEVLGASVGGVNFEVHLLPSGEVDGETEGTITSVDAAAYSFTIETESGPLQLFVYAETIFSGDAGSIEELEVGWPVMVQYYTSTGLAVEVDASAGR